MHIPKSIPAFIAMLLLPWGAFAGEPVGESSIELVNLVRSGDSQAALAAIRAGADVNATQADGTSPLLWAVYRVDHELVAALLQHGAKPDVGNALGATPLSEAVNLADAALVTKLLKARADPNLGNEDGQTPLMLAARTGALPIVQALVKAGARVNEREKFREQTALMWAVAANNPAVVDFLIRHKADVEARAAVNDWGNQITSEPRAQYRNTGGLTPLLYAARFGCLDCVKSLLKAGAQIDRPTPDGVTPLMTAIDNSNFDLANLLLDAGANPRLFDWWGRTAVYLAADMRTRGGGGRAGPEGVRAVDDAPPPQPGALQLLRRLLEAGVDPNPQLDMHRPFRGRFTDDLITTGCTPLLRAALSVDHEAVAVLLQHGALPDLPNVMGVTPLMAAAGIGALVGLTTGGQGPIGGSDPQDNAITVIGLLIKAGADVNARISDTTSRTAIIARPSSMTTREGQTALFGAISKNWTRVARFLIEQGAQLDVRDAAGKTLADALTGQAGGRDTPSSDEMVKLIKSAMGA
ncbi:MAG: ankyrin repeat domain-containing protein [Steroidobacteraceae bacterium]